MKKIIMLTVFVLCFTLIMIFYLMFYNEPQEEVKYKDYTEIITSNSSWIDLEKSDFNSLILKTYSNKVLTFIDSLENGVPVIIELEGGKLCETGKNNFIVASAFSSSDNVTVYMKSDNSYTKLLISLEELLEYATRFFLLNNTEVL